MLSTNEKLADINQPETNQNTNGKILQNICEIGKPVLLNNLLTESTYFHAALTFRQRNKWVSELDLSILPRDLIECVIDFNINHDLNLPSNHAPISLTFNRHSSRTAETELLFQMSSQLDLYIVRDKKIPCNKPI